MSDNNEKSKKLDNTNKVDHPPPSYHDVAAVEEPPAYTPPPFLIHPVRMTDTLPGICIYYRLTAELKSELFKLNPGLSESTVIAFETLKIPTSPNASKLVLPRDLTPAEQAKKLLAAKISRFQVQTKCTDYDEAKFYIESYASSSSDGKSSTSEKGGDEKGKSSGSDNDDGLGIEAAVEAYRKDVEWERENGTSSSSNSNKKKEKERVNKR